jgi:hypothetical protein
MPDLRRLRLDMRSALRSSRGCPAGRIITCLLSAAAVVVFAGRADARHLARTDPAEPIFTQRPFIEKDLELDVGWERDGGSQLLTPVLGNTWVFWNRLETTVEVPVGVRIPDSGLTVADLSDVTLGLQLLVCCSPGKLLDYLSIRAEVDLPTGNRSKDIGGTGGYTVSLLPGRLFTIAESLPDLFLQMQIAYTQEIRPSDDAMATAARLGRPLVHEKDFIWNIAATQKYSDGRIRPVIELLGTQVLDAVARADEGTIVELAGGLWLAPFYDEHWLAPVSIGMGYRWPVTSRNNAFGAALLIVERAFD